MDISNSILPEEAQAALLAYLKCDTFEKLADCILPAAAANEWKQGKGVAGNYFFAFPSASYTDETILECTRLTQEQAQSLGAFWATGFALQGISADFTAEDGYDTVVSAIGSLEESDTRLRITNRLEILKIQNAGWIIVPSADMNTFKMEPII